MNRTRTAPVTSGITLLISIAICYAADADLPKIKQPAPSPKASIQIPPPDAAAVQVPDGYRAEVFLSGLDYPSSIEFDEKNIYIAETGSASGDPVARARILVIPRSGNGQPPGVLTDQVSAPVTDLLVHGDRLYISHRGRISVCKDGKVTDIVTDLPSFGDHPNGQLAAGPDGRLYFGQGSATNSGVVGADNYFLGWLARWPGEHETSGVDLTLTDETFEILDPLAALGGKSKTVKTSPYQPLGKTSPDGQVKKTAKANASILCVKTDGTGLETYASGLRNPFGLLWGPDKKLYAAENCADERGSRQIANAPECLWVVEKDQWYGFPDFAAGIPVTDPRYAPKNAPPPKLLIKNPPPVSKPFLTFEPHASVVKIDFSRSTAFGFKGQLFLAASGDYAPVTSTDQTPAGYWVKRIDTTTGKAEPFFAAKASALGKGDLAHTVTAGPRRPLDVRFDGDDLYIVDIGAETFVPSATGPMPVSFPGTGVVWRVGRIPAADSPVKTQQ